MKTLLPPSLYEEAKRLGYNMDNFVVSQPFPVNPKPTATTEGVLKVLQSL